MNLVGIEPTPNPNSMKLLLDEILSSGERVTYRPGDEPPSSLIAALTQIDGVLSVFHTADFMAVQRTPRADWGTILGEITKAFVGAAESVSQTRLSSTTDLPTEFMASMQVFRNLPMQVKVTGGTREIRRGLARRFDAAVKTAVPAAKNALMERRWVDLGRRYGAAEDVADQVTAEVEALYHSDRLQRLTERALGDDWDQPEQKPDHRRLVRDLDNACWRVRYRALRELGADTTQLAKLIELASDAHLAVRRQATALLGLMKDAKVLAPLCAALRDPIAAVRRTAGDALTELGNPEASSAMMASLTDPSPLVRWRAARFLFELGDDASLPDLRAARDDQCFEVRMQIEQAIERIETGMGPDGPVWQRMAASGGIDP